MDGRRDLGCHDRRVGGAGGRVSGMSISGERPGDKPDEHEYGLQITDALLTARSGPAAGGHPF